MRSGLLAATFYLAQRSQPTQAGLALRACECRAFRRRGSKMVTTGRFTYNGAALPKTGSACYNGGMFAERKTTVRPANPSDRNTILN